MVRAWVATVLVCVSACGVAPLSDRERVAGDDYRTQAQIDAYAIMVGMDAARIRAALLARNTAR